MLDSSEITTKVVPFVVLVGRGATKKRLDSEGSMQEVRKPWEKKKNNGGRGENRWRLEKQSYWNA